MTATVNGTHRPDLLRAIQRADHRWRQDTADDPAEPGYLTHLAAALEPLVDPSADQGHPSDDDGELEEVRADNAKLADQVAVLQRQVGQLRADYGALAAERADLRTENSRLAGLLADGGKHHHRWDWPGPDERVEPCECGKPWPRYLEYVEDEVEPDVEPWGVLFDRLRVELADWGEQARAG